MKICRQCGQEFDSRTSLEMHQLGKHNSKENRQNIIDQKIDLARRLNYFKKTGLYSLLGLFLIAIIYFAIFLSSRETYSSGPVHWHADLAVTVCGENIALPKPLSAQIAHNQPFIGTPLMHLHAEPVIHLEGVILNKEDITLGKFMKAIGLNFKDDQLLERSNGVLCPNGQPGKVKLLTNGQETKELSRKVIIDGERYKLIFE